MNIETITVFKSWVDIASGMKSDAERGKFYHGLCVYSLTGIVPEFDSFMYALFQVIKPSIDKSNRRKAAQLEGLKTRKQNKNGLQTDLQTDLQNGLQTDLQTDLQNGLQTDLQTDTTRARKTGTRTGKKRVSKDTPKEKISFVGLIPEKLNTESFREAWLKWEDERKLNRKKLTTRAAQLQLSLLAAYSEADAIQMIEKSISCGWQGIFPLNNQPKQLPSEHKYGGI